MPATRRDVVPGGVWRWQRTERRLVNAVSAIRPLHGRV